MLRFLMASLCGLFTLIGSPSRDQDPMAVPKEASRRSEKRPVDLDRIRESWGIEASGPAVLLVRSPAIQKELELTPRQLVEMPDLERARMEGMTEVARQTRIVDWGIGCSTRRSRPTGRTRKPGSGSSSRRSNTSGWGLIGVPWV